MIRRILNWLFRRTNWDSLPWEKPATVADEFSKLNGER